MRTMDVNPNRISLFPNMLLDYALVEPRLLGLIVSWLQLLHRAIAVYAPRSQVSAWSMSLK